MCTVPPLVVVSGSTSLHCSATTSLMRASVSLITRMMAASRTPCRLPLSAARAGHCLRLRPTHAGHLSAAPVTALAADPAQHVTAQAVRGRIEKSGDLVHLGDGSAGSANRRRHGAGRVALLQVLGDVGRGGRELRPPVLDGPALPRLPRVAVRLAGVI